MRESDAVIAIVDDDRSQAAGQRSDDLRDIFCVKRAEEVPVEIMPHRIAVVIAAGLLVSLSIVPAKAQSQPPQFVTTVWQTEQGLPQNSVNAMVQDHRGYLWMGTFGGLARFDGERFTVFDSADTPGFGSDQIFSLFESRSGVLWIGTVDGGLTRLQDGVATAYTERDGLPSGFISSIREDAEGNVWINTSRGVAHFAGTKLEAYPTHRGKAVREFFLQARDGSRWLRCGGDVVRFGADGSMATLHPIKPSVFLVHEARDGSVWIAFRDQYRLVRYYQGVFSDVPLPPMGRPQLAGAYPEQSILAMAEDTDGELLLLTPAGLSRIVDGRLGPPEALPLPATGRELPKARSLLVDREGNRWIGTIGRGLVRLRRAPLTAYGRDEGLSDSSFSTVFQDREGRIWLGGDLLYWFDGHRFHFVPGVVNVLTIAQTRDGDLWFGGYGGVYRWRAGLLNQFKIDAPAVKVIHQDRQGTLWIGALTEERAGGLYRFGEGKLEQVPGISDVRAIAEDRDGGFWLGGLEGLRHMRGSKTVTYDQKQGLSSNTVYDIHQDSTGTLWVATYGGGLNRFRDGRFKAITTKDGLADNMLLGILDDGSGNLWLSSNQGIFRLSLRELNDFADGRTSSISAVKYGSAEGMRSTESNDGSPAGWKTTDGRIWFPTLRGVVAIDPTAGNRLPPPVMLEEAWANNFTLTRAGQTSVPPGNHTLDFRFTALSFSAPEKVRFKYRLVPFDKDWVDAGTRRTAHYTNMPPGKYSFHVTAANSYGVWNEQGASVRFVLKPHFYQTLWFRLLLLIGVVLLAGSVHRLRVSHLRARAERLKQLVDGRTVELRAEIQAREAVEAELRRAQAELEDRVRDRTAELERSEAYLAEAQRLSHTGSWALDVGSGKYVYSSEESFRIYGFDPQEGTPTGEAVFRRIHPEDRNRWQENFQRSLREKVDTFDEYRIVLSDGTVKHIHTIRHPVLNSAGDVVKLLGTSIDITERKRAEDALRRSEAYLASAQKLTHTGTFASDGKSGEPIYWSEEMSRLWGLDPQQGLPTRNQSRQRIHPEDLEGFKQASDRVFVKKLDLDLEFRIVQSDGTVKHAHILAHPVLNAEGEVLEVVGAVADITERKRAEEALRRSEAYLTETQRLSHTGSWASECTGRPLYWSEEVFRIFGLDPQQGIPTPDQPLRRIHPEDLDKFLGTFNRAVQAKVDFEVEARVVLPGGTVRHIHGIGHPVLNANGEIVEVVGTVIDVTEHKRAEEVLRRSEAYLTEGQRLTHTGSFAWSPVLERALYWSEEMFRIYGFDPQHGLPTQGELLKRIHPEDLDKFKQVWERAIHEKVDIEGEFRIVLPDRTVKYAHATRHPVLNANGEVVEVTGTIMDITERKRAEEERQRLRQLEADLAHINRVSMLGELAASIAHEVNQPLSGVVSNASAGLRWLAADTPNVEEAREGLRRIVRDGKRAGEVIGRIRALTKRAATARERLDLNETIQDVVALVGDEAKKKSVIIRTQFADDLSPVSADRVQLQQVILNLVMNAIEAMSSVGDRARELAITTRNLDPDQVQVTVEDSGTGIDPQAIDKIFDSFYTTKPGGMGMGLSISRSILQAHGGRLWATAKDGLGTIFSFTLPTYQEEGPHAGVAAV